MKKSLFSVHLCVFFTLVSAAVTRGQTWTNINAPEGPYHTLACSADGRTVIAAFNVGTVYLSTNACASWFPTISSGGPWHCAACSSDGTKLYVGGEYLYISTNSGQTWTTNETPDGYSLGVACSADGTKVAAGLGAAKPILLSTNSGATFTSVTPPEDGFASIASSADGTELVAMYGSQFEALGNYPIYRSIDSGLTWTMIGVPSNGWIELVCSADGTTIAAASTVLGFCFSKDSGMTWTANSAAPSYAIACSADGTRFLGAQNPAYSSYLMTSLDSGKTWTTNGPAGNWRSVAMSADGSILFACSGGVIYMAQIPAQPSLKIVTGGTNLVLSWPLPSTGFVLQQSSQINSTNWVGVTNAVTASGYYNQVTVSPPQTGNAYYRLVNQQSSL